MKNEFEYKLVVVKEGKEVFSAPLGFRELDMIASYYPDDEDSNDLYQFLPYHPSEEIRACVAGKEYLNKKVVAILKSDKSLAVLKSLLSYNANERVVFDEKLEELIKLENSEISGAIIDLLYSFGKTDCEKITSLFSKAIDPKIRFQLADNRHTPKKILKSLLNDKDASVRSAAKKTLYE